MFAFAIFNCDDTPSNKESHGRGAEPNLCCMFRTFEGSKNFTMLSFFLQMLSERDRR